MQKKYDLVVAGSGAAGILAAITARKNNKKVLLIEKLSSLGSKLKATGGGKCNLTNTLDSETFMANFGKNGRFITPALDAFNNKDLIEFFHSIGIKTKCSDGFRVFPDTHNSNSVLKGLNDQLKILNIDILLDTTILDISTQNNTVTSIETNKETIACDYLILATGGLGYPSLGTTGDGFALAKKLGHKITSTYPAMTPLKTKQTWQANCTAHTIPKATIKIDIKKYSKLSAKGDLIFTKKGLRGPVILDFARYITPLLEKYKEVPVLINITKGLNQEQILNHLKKEHQNNPQKTILEHLNTLLATPVAQEILNLCDIKQTDKFNNLKGYLKENLLKTLAWTPFTITDHEGFEKAMITCGGVSLKNINPNTMESKIINNLYFAGEIIDIDGPCGGYNLQWAFSSGYLAGQLL